MEFHEKIQALRKQKGITQEELAEKLYVSRTAISKWESGRGYPNIDSLKAIARFFGVTIDQLLSGDELLTLAEEDTKQKTTHFRDLVYGLLDLSMALLFFLPLFATKGDGGVQSASLLTLGGVRLYLKIAYFASVISVMLMGVLTLALQKYPKKVCLKCKTPLSLAVSTVAVLLMIVSSQPYAAVFGFVLLAIKTLMTVKRR